MTTTNFIGKTGLVLIIGQMRYGVGADLDEAKKNFRAQGGGLTRGLAVIEFTAQTEYHGVDQMGRFHYKVPGVDIVKDKADAFKLTEVAPGKRIPATR